MILGVLDIYSSRRTRLDDNLSLKMNLEQKSYAVDNPTLYNVTLYYESCKIKDVRLFNGNLYLTKTCPYLRPGSHQPAGAAMTAIQGHAITT